MAFLEEGQTILMVNIGNKHIIDKLIMESNHTQIIGSPQDFHNRLILINVSLQKGDILSLEIFFNEEVGMLGNPFGERERELWG